MNESLLLVLVIVAVAWLMDRGWAVSRNRTPTKKPAPRSSNQDETNPTKPAQAPPRSQSSPLREDWLRLGKRSQ